jgi:hypothetical protein
MSRLATAVSVITTDGPAGLAGFTATAVASVSDAPPTLLVCANSASQSAKRLLLNGRFAVSTLGSGQRPVAERFSGRTGLQLEARFSEGGWRRSSGGLPIIDGSLVAFECRLVDTRSVATHEILIGEVMAIRLGGEGASLIYLRRGYREL